MKVPFIFRSPLTRLCVAGVGGCLGMSLAFAGPEEDNARAKVEFERGDLPASLSLWRKAAQAGYAPSQVWLGDILDKGDEDVEAAAWYQKAADQGNADGEYGLGQMYLKGEGVKKDAEKALLYFERAATRNHVDSVKVMMAAYRQGSMGLPINQTQADAWEAKLVAILPGYTKSVPKTDGKPPKGAPQ